MAPPTKPTFDVKNLCILPPYDGNPNELYSFLKAATTRLNHYFDPTPDNYGCLQNVLILQGILSKLGGRAKEVISIYSCGNWEEIKAVLIQNFADQRDENTLTRDLVNMRQMPNETPYQFHEKCMSILNTISNYIDIHNDNDAVIGSKKAFFRQQTLTTFLAGLREPLGSTIRAMRPTNLAIALQYIQEEMNIRYLQKSYTPVATVSTRKPIPVQRPVYVPHMTQQTLQHPGYEQAWQNQPRPQFPRGPVTASFRANPPTQRFFNNQQVFGKPQNVWINRNGASPQQPKPVPMSISTRNTFQSSQARRNPNFRSQPQQQRPNFTSEELFNIEQEQPYEDASYQYDHYLEPTVDEYYANENQTEMIQEQPNFQEEDDSLPET